MSKECIELLICCVKSKHGVIRRDTFVLSHDMAANVDFVAVSRTFQNLTFHTVSHSFTQSMTLSRMLNSWPCCGHFKN